MGLIFDATVEAGKVYIVDKKNATKVIVPDAILLCAGELPSTGRLFVLEDGTPFYTTNTQPDSKITRDLILKLLDITSTLAKTVPSIGSPLNPAADAELQALKQVIDKAKLI